MGKYMTSKLAILSVYIAEKIFELTKCENKSLRELPCKKNDLLFPGVARPYYRV
jgi:hypothetical protein